MLAKAMFSVLLTARCMTWRSPWRFSQPVAPGVGVGRKRARVLPPRSYIRMVDGAVTARVHLVDHSVKEGVNTASLLACSLSAQVLFTNCRCSACRSWRRELPHFARYIVNGLAAQHG